MLRWLLIAMVIYIPYELRMPAGLGLKGLNVLNLMFLLALGLVMVRSNTPAPKTPLKAHFIFFMSMLGLALVHALLRGDQPVMDDITYYKTAIFYMLLYFLYYHAVNDVETLRKVFIAMLFISALAMVQAVRQGLDYGLGNYNFTRRAAGPFSYDWTNSNRAGVFFAMFTPLFVAVAMQYTKKKWVRLGALFCVGLGVFATFVTYSRQAYAILAVTMLFILLRKNIVVAALLIAAIANYQLWAPTAAVQRVEMTTEKSESGGEQLEESAESRFVIWAGAWSIIKEQPWGIGLHRFIVEIRNHSPYARDAHNHYVLTATEAGIQGFIALVTLLFGLLFLARPLLQMKDNPEALTLGLGFTAATIGLMLGSLYGSPLYFGPVMGNYWIMAGLVAKAPVLLARENAPSASAPQAEPEPLHRRIRRAGRRRTA